MAKNELTLVETEKKVKPITLTDHETGDVYTLEFDRESVRFAERRGFKTEDIAAYPMTKIPEFFWYAFRMHHKRVSMEEAERILTDKMGGMPDGMLERLGQLYAAPYEALMSKNADEEKNGRMTVEF